LKPRHDIPDDPALPGLAALRGMGLARALPALGLGDEPVELDAGTFLATVWRIGLKGEDLTAEARATEQTFVARTAGVLNPAAVAWYRAAVLLRLASKCVRRRTEWLAHGHALLREAARQIEAAG
jgi:hypothetical protein